PPTHLEIRDTSRFRPISDQQMVSAGQHSNPNLDDITYLGPYVEGQNVTVVCTSFGGILVFNSRNQINLVVML
ncbi:unnamed protein product, partial [Allacma fusca]